MNIPDDMLLMHNGKFDQLPPSHHFANELLLGKAPCKQYFFSDIWNIIQNTVLPLKDFCLWHFLLKSIWVLDADRFSSYLYPNFANIGGIAMNLYCCKYLNTVLISLWYLWAHTFVFLEVIHINKHLKQVYPSLEGYKVYYYHLLPLNTFAVEYFPISQIET